MIVFIVFSFLLSRAGFKANSSAVNQGIKEILQSRNTITAEDDTNVVVSKEFVNRFLGLREKMDSCTVDAVNNGYLLYDSLTDKNKIIKIANDMHCRLDEVKTFFDRTNQFVKNFPAEMKTLYPQREDIESIALRNTKIYSDRQYVKKIEEMVSSLNDYFEKSDELYSFILEHFDSFNVETRDGTTELVFLEEAQDIENQYYKLLNETLDTKDASEKAAQAVADYFLSWTKDHGFDLDINQLKENLNK